MQANNNITINHHDTKLNNIRRKSLEEAYKTFRSTNSATTGASNNSSVYIINTSEDPIWVPQKAQPQHPPSESKFFGGRNSCAGSTTSATTVTATLTSGRSSVTPKKHRLHNNLETGNTLGPSSPSKNGSFLNNKNISTAKLIPADEQSSTQVIIFKFFT